MMNFAKWEQRLLRAEECGDLAEASRIRGKIDAYKNMKAETAMRTEIRMLNHDAKRRQRQHNKRAHDSLRGINKGKPKDRDVAEVMRSEAKKRSAPWEGRGNRD